MIGVAHPDLSNLLRGSLRGFSVERIMRMLTALGQNVEIVLQPHGAETKARRIADRHVARARQFLGRRCDRLRLPRRRCEIEFDDGGVYRYFKTLPEAIYEAFHEGGIERELLPEPGPRTFSLRPVDLETRVAAEAHRRLTFFRSPRPVGGRPVGAAFTVPRAGLTPRRPRGPLGNVLQGRAREERAMLSRRRFSACAICAAVGGFVATEAAAQGQPQGQPSGLTRKVLSERDVPDSKYKTVQVFAEIAAGFVVAKHNAPRGRERLRARRRGRAQRRRPARPQGPGFRRLPDPRRTRPTASATAPRSRSSPSPTWSRRTSLSPPRLEAERPDARRSLRRRRVRRRREGSAHQRRLTFFCSPTSVAGWPVRVDFT